MSRNNCGQAYIYRRPWLGGLGLRGRGEVEVSRRQLKCAVSGRQGLYLCRVMTAVERTYTEDQVSEDSD